MSLFAAFVTAVLAFGFGLSLGLWVAGGHIKKALSRRVDYTIPHEMDRMWETLRRAADEPQD